MATGTTREVKQQLPEFDGRSSDHRDSQLGTLYLEREFVVSREQAQAQVAVIGNGHGINGYHFDNNRRNFYLFLFKSGDSCGHLKEGLRSVARDGVEQIFGDIDRDNGQDQLLAQIRSCLADNEGLIERVCIHCIFTGDPQLVERSHALDKLREDLESKKYLIDKYFRRTVKLIIEFRSARTRTAAATRRVHGTHNYPVHLNGSLTRKGPNGENMVIGFLPLTDLHAIYQGMGLRFLERNIRGALPDTEAVNCSIQQALKEIVLERRQQPSMFTFNHNGITLSAEALTAENKHFIVTEPRLLNGAQTVISLARFIASSEKLDADFKALLGEIHVLSRVITNSSPEFVTTVTVNNNRQNPVHPWNLRANDMIQLELQDRFRDEVGIYYERQQNAFASLSEDELKLQGISQYKAIDMLRLARTFLASEGEVDRMSHYREIFEDDRLYNSVFNESRLEANVRKIVMCYKIQFRLRSVANQILEKGATKYGFVRGARTLLWALLCQAILNDPLVDTYADQFGQCLGTETKYKEWLSAMATNRCRFLLSDLGADKVYAQKVAEGNFAFMNTSDNYRRAMESAHKRWGWAEKRLS